MVTVDGAGAGRGERPDLAVVIVSYGTEALLRACLGALPAATAGLRSITHVVDNDSPDGSAAMVQREFPEVELTVSDRNLGFPRANNLILARTEARYAVLLNPDTEPHPGSLRRLVDFMDGHPVVGACGPQLLDPDGSIQRVGGRFPTLWPDLLRSLGLHRLAARCHDASVGPRGAAFDRVREVDWASGACLLVRAETMRQVGMLDERFFILYEDIDWCRRIRSGGWTIVYVPEVRVVHHLMATAKDHDPSEARRRMARRRAHYRRSRHLYYRKTAGPWGELGARGVTLLETLKIGVAIRGGLVWMLTRSGIRGRSPSRPSTGARDRRGRA